MSRFKIGPIVVHSERWVGRCFEPSSPISTVKISESCDCTYLKGIIVLEFDSINQIGVAHFCPRLNVSGTGLAYISTACSGGIVAELILDILAAPPAFNIVGPVWVVPHIESHFAILSIGVDIVA